MFEGISKGLESALSLFRGQGKLTEGNMQEALRAVTQALLEADVNFTVAQDFTERVSQAALGTHVLNSLNPYQQFVGIVHRELINLMGPVDHSLHLRRGEVVVLMLCGLQGSGKTTTCGKLARMLHEANWRPMLVAADMQRPAAIDQLKIIGQQLGVPVYSEAPPASAVKVCQNGVTAARKAGDIDVVILDTAGRLHIDAELMHELEQIDLKLSPQQILLVCDAMTGQDAVNSAKAFNEALELDGVILTKLDGDARGGAALSVKAVTGVPIKFIGVGEQLEKLEPFHPDRMAGRILGMGDVLTLVEQAQKQFDAEQMAAQQEKMAQGKFTLVDFRQVMGQVKKLGPLRQIMNMIPGMGKVADMLGSDVDPEQDLKQIEGIIDSMTPLERGNPDIIDIGRRRRIAQGSGADPAEVNKLLKDFSSMSGLMQQMAGMNKLQQFRQIKQMADAGHFNPGAQLPLPKPRVVQSPVDRRAEQEKKKRMRKEAKRQRKKNRR
ncbi:MAG TPA: signal recognition particle protein [Planctomycetaceae bacterium]|nr:signal recognition particle protein [Planctomycetaceae bacterium]